MNVLYLSAWYPTPSDEMSGLFVRKHLECVRKQGVDARVIYSEQKGWRYWCDLCRQYRQLRHQGWRPDLVQVNVLNKNGLLAYWWWLTQHIPYIIVEHWSGYLPDNDSFRGGWHGRMMLRIGSRAQAILPVSEMLMDAMKSCGIDNPHWQVIDNVVDDFFYTPIANKSRQSQKEMTHFIHVSCFDEKAKNVRGLLRSYQAALQQRPALHLTMVGYGQDWQAAVDYAQELGIPNDALTWTGELAPIQVCQQMQNADGLILFSNYETYGIVLAEAMAVGLPSISTTRCGLSVPPDSGIRIPCHNEAALTQAIIDWANGKTGYSSEIIQSHAHCYSEEVVGKSLIKIYQSVAHS